MTTAALTRSATRAEPGYSFRSATRMEWLKLRSVRSTSWILLVFAVGMIGLSVLVLSHTHWAAMSAADRASFCTRESPFTPLSTNMTIRRPFAGGPTPSDPMSLSFRIRLLAPQP